MSLERILQLLQSFGFSRVEAEVYVYLAKKGSQRGKDLENGLKIAKQQLYFILKNLQRKNIVSISHKRPALFSALAFEKLLNLYVKLNVDQAKIIEETKEEWLNDWRDMTKNDRNKS